MIENLFGKSFFPLGKNFFCRALFSQEKHFAGKNEKQKLLLFNIIYFKIINSLIIKILCQVNRNVKTTHPYLFFWLNSPSNSLPIVYPILTQLPPNCLSNFNSAKRSDIFNYNEKVFFPPKNRNFKIMFF